MTIFDDLSKEYESWHTRYLDDERASMRFAYAFADGLKSYIGAPDSFKSSFDEGSPKPYVKAMKLIDHGDDSYTYLDPEMVSDVIQRGEGGYWWYGISLTLEIAPTTWPKQAFGIPICFILSDSHCKMRITKLTEGEFEFDISNVENYAHAYAFIVSLLQKILRAKPSDQVQEKRPIGFRFPTAPKE